MRERERDREVSVLRRVDVFNINLDVNVISSAGQKIPQEEIKEGERSWKPADTHLAYSFTCT